MKATVNTAHPRMAIQGSPQPIPLCINTGSLMSSTKELFGLDELGIAVSIYFKLLKSLTIFFTLCSVVCIPLIYFYGCGDNAKQATGQLQQYLSQWTLGNLGESSQVCKENNLRLYNTMTLWCPSGTKMQSLLQFGLQKADAKEGDNICPQTVDTSGSDSETTLKLDLD